MAAAGRVKLDGLRVGLAWAGNPDDIRLDRRRSITLDRLAPLAAVPGISLVSLQKGGGAALADSAARARRCTTGPTTSADFADTAALVQTLDLVIAVDTAVAHLAGALGKPVWLLNRFDTCWRWLLNCTTVPCTRRCVNSASPSPVRGRRVAAVCHALSQAASGADPDAATSQAAVP